MTYPTNEVEEGSYLQVLPRPERGSTNSIALKRRGRGVKITRVVGGDDGRVLTGEERTRMFTSKNRSQCLMNNFNAWTVGKKPVHRIE